MSFLNKLVPEQASRQWLDQDQHHRCCHSPSSHVELNLEVSPLLTSHSSRLQADILGSFLSCRIGAKTSHAVGQAQIYQINMVSKCVTAAHQESGETMIEIPTQPTRSTARLIHANGGHGLPSQSEPDVGGCWMHIR